jgi:hypothetical protein
LVWVLTANNPLTPASQLKDRQGNLTGVNCAAKSG